MTVLDQRRAQLIDDLRSVGTNGPPEFTEEQWQFFFGDEPEEATPSRGWRGLVVVALILGLLASSAFIAWRSVIRDRNDLRNPAEILAVAEDVVAESPYNWLVTGVEVQPIQDIDIGGFVAYPGDGIIVIDRRPWSEKEIADVVSHEIGHLLDFAAYAGAVVPRGGLESEVWAECASVDAGFRDLDGEGRTERYRCSPNDYRVYLTAISLLDEVCRPWGELECRPVEAQEKGG